MATKVIYIAGVPASGKSTMFKRVRELLFGDATEFKEGKVRGLQSTDGHYIMLGVFDGTTFEGTDKLSMTVIDDAIAYAKKLSGSRERYVIFVEGDRLFNYRFLSETRALLLLLDANEIVLKNRHIARGDTQTDTFLRSRRSKVENFISKYKAQRIWNNTLHDQERILNFVIKVAKEYTEEV